MMGARLYMSPGRRRTIAARLRLRRRVSRTVGRTGQGPSVPGYGPWPRAQAWRAGGGADAREAQRRSGDPGRCGPDGATRAAEGGGDPRSLRGHGEDRPGSAGPRATSGPGSRARSDGRRGDGRHASDPRQVPWRRPDRSRGREPVRPLGRTLLRSAGGGGEPACPSQAGRDQEEARPAPVTGGCALEREVLTGLHDGRLPYSVHAPGPAQGSRYGARARSAASSAPRNAAMALGPERSMPMRPARASSSKQPFAGWPTDGGGARR